jgi:hypothetical protein
MFETAPNGYFIRDVIVLHGLRKGCAEGALLKNAAANKLSAYLSKNSVTACLENVDPSDLS